MLAGLALGWWLAAGSEAGKGTPSDPSGSEESSVSASPAVAKKAGKAGKQKKSTASDQAVEELCSRCHRMPSPQLLTKQRWRDEIEKMFKFAGAPEGPIGEVSLGQAIRYYMRRAPKAHPVRKGPKKADSGPLAFKARPLKKADLPGPTISSVRLLPFSHRQKNDLLVADMRQGKLMFGRPWTGNPTLWDIGTVKNPCHIEVVDLDKDGRRELLVADLGVFQPSEKRKGRVLWLRPMSDGRLQEVVIASGLGRVSDVRAADFDGDGDMDLVVAVFGLRDVGKILLLENRSRSYARPEFLPRILDPRPGTITVPVVDLNGDGLPDFVALISQHYEEVVAFVNTGKGRFERKSIWRAPHPNWGFTSMEVVDLDGDKDMDFLLTNGDTLDSPREFLLPYHGVSWLENLGGGRHEMRLLGPLYGAHRAVSGDMDGDGDLDVVASAFLPYATYGEFRFPYRLPSLLWFEQTQDKHFEPHVLEQLQVDRATVDVGDYDGDGDLDVAAGAFLMGIIQIEGGAPAVTIYENLGAKKGGG